MIMFAWMLASALVASPLKFELRLPERVASGESVQVRLVAKNVSDRSVVVTKLEPSGFDLGARIKYDVERAGKKVERDARGNLIAQWVVGPKITPGVFEVLKPGEEVTLLEEVFAHEFPRAPEDKRDWATLSRTPLKPGTYTAHVDYSFYRTFDPKREKGSIPYPGSQPSLSSDVDRCRPPRRPLRSHEVAGKGRTIG